VKLPPQDYTLESFLQFLRDNHDSVFDEEERKKWLKVYGVLHSLSDWQGKLFSPTETRRLGEVTEIRIPKTTALDGGEEEFYYAIEYKRGLLLFFTSAIQESYKATLDDRIRRTRGVTQAWISPERFQQVWQSIIDRFGGFVYRFTSRRAALDNTPAKIRPTYQRRFNYTGDDGSQVVKELQDAYGVTPDSMYIRVDPALIVQITNSCFFSAREISHTAIQILFHVLDVVSDELLLTKKTSERLGFEIEIANMLGNTTLPRVASLTAGQISLSGRPLTASVVEEFVTNAEDFSFLDQYTKEGSLAFSATVVDESKGSVFDVSMSETEITMIPKFNTTFESFITFLKTVRDQLDERASLRVWGLVDG